MVNNGPYILARWVPNDVIQVRPNTNYWDAASIKNDGIDFAAVSDEQTEERMFRSGRLHITEDVPQSKAPEYRENNPDMLRIDPWIGCYFYRVNTKREPFGDPRVREALSLALDREAICTKVMKTGPSPAYFLTPPGVGGYTPHVKVDYDPEAARKLLAEAGYPNGEGFPTIDILYNTKEQHRVNAEAIQQMWKQELGIDVTLTNQEWGVYLSSTSNERLDYDLARAGWIGDVVDGINFLECFITGNGNNRTGWGNAEYDRLLAEAIQQSNLKQRHALYNQAETILMDELPIIPIYHYTRAFLIQPNVRGYEPNILAYRAYHQLWLDESGAE